METETNAGEWAGRSGTQFATTHWSTVLAAGESESAGASNALEKLCRRYRFPLYGFVCHRGYPREQAEDLTQGFFEQLIEKELAGRADPERGRFHTFLPKVLTQFLADERRRGRTLKRGGDLPAGCRRPEERSSKTFFVTSPDIPRRTE